MTSRTNLVTVLQYSTTQVPETQGKSGKHNQTKLKKNKSSNIITVERYLWNSESSVLCGRNVNYSVNMMHFKDLSVQIYGLIYWV